MTREQAHSQPAQPFAVNPSVRREKVAGKSKLFLILATAALCAAPITGQTGKAAQGNTAQGNGAAFGTRNTRVCTETSDKPTGPQLQKAFICEAEFYTPPGSSAASLHLVSDVNLQFSKGRPYNPNSDAYSSIDVTQPVYDARGSYIGWNCDGPPAGVGNLPVAGKNCWKYLGTGVHGIAFRDTFGTWHVKVCCMVSADGDKTVYYPPPTNQF